MAFFWRSNISAAVLAAVSLSTAPQQRSTLAAELRIQSDNATPAADVMSSVNGFAVDADGQIFVGQRYSVLVFDSAGHFRKRIGREGQGPGEFTDVGDMGWSGDSLWVSESAARSRTSFFSRNGNYLTMRNDSPGIAPSGMSVNVLNELARNFRVVIRASIREDSLPTRTTIETADGRTVAFLSEVKPIRYYQNIRIGDRIIRLPQIFSDAPIVSVPPSGNYVVVIQRDSTVSVDSSVSIRRLQSDGTQISLTKVKVGRSRVAQADIDTVLKSLARGFTRGASFSVDQFMDAARRQLVFPAYYPPAQMALAGDDETVWLRVQPGFTDWVAVDQAGRIIHRVRLAADQRMLHVSRNRVWVMESRPGADIALIRYRVNN